MENEPFTLVSPGILLRVPLNFYHELGAKITHRQASFGFSEKDVESAVLNLRYPRGERHLNKNSHAVISAVSGAIHVYNNEYRIKNHPTVSSEKCASINIIDGNEKVTCSGCPVQIGTETVHGTNVRIARYCNCPVRRGHVTCHDPVHMAWQSSIKAMTRRIRTEHDGPARKRRKSNGRQ